MKILNKYRLTLRKACSSIHLIDKCLIIIMFLLLIQSAYSLFFNIPSSSEFNTIDIIIRTATASIFGYFLSSNFIRNSISDSKKKNESNAESNDVTILDSSDTNETKNKIGFTNSDEDKTLESGKAAFTPNQKTSTELYVDNHLQIIITTSIAIFCLFILTIIRNISGSTGNDLTSTAQATISQFRDLVSGCIGFLIGVPTTKK